MTKIWTPTPTGFKLDTGALELAVTDQSDRGCGWCWHVSVNTTYGYEEISRDGNMPTAEAAKDAAITWARTYCELTLAAIAA
jgi:hypothetical protein